MKIFFGEVGKPSAVKQQINKERPGDIKAPSQERSAQACGVGSTIRLNAASVFCYASTASMNSLVKDFDVALFFCLLVYCTTLCKNQCIVGGRIKTGYLGVTTRRRVAQIAASGQWVEPKGQVRSGAKNDIAQPVWR
jgi:hypothetical protein